MSLKVKSRKVDGIVVIDMFGRITCGEPQMLFRSTVERFVCDGSKRLVLNLSDVDFVDTTGLGTLVWAKASLVEQGGDVNLLGLQKRIKDVLVMTKLAVVFDFYEQESEAIAALSS